MADKLILRRELVHNFSNIRRQDWKKVAEKLELIWDEEHGKGSHAVIRDPKYPKPYDTRGLLATVQKNIYKEVNKSIFKNLVKKGINEDDIWKALGMLKQSN